MSRKQLNRLDYLGLDCEESSQEGKEREKFPRVACSLNSFVARISYRVFAV